MSDENKKIDSDVNKDTANASETTKKPTATRKKAKAKTKSTNDSEPSGTKNKIAEKLKAMGVMSDQNTHAEHIDDSGLKAHQKAIIASVVAVLVVTSFVWMLNKKAAKDHTAYIANAPQSVSYATPQNNFSSAPPSANASYYGGYAGNNPASQSNGSPDYKPQQQLQYQKWVQQQRAQQQLQYKKWMKQQQRFQEQQQLQRQKWMQQQQQYAQQQQQPQQHQYAQQQQQPQQQQWPQQSYYNYPQYGGYQGQSGPPSYNYAPNNQQSGSYYQR